MLDRLIDLCPECRIEELQSGFENRYYGRMKMMIQSVRIESEQIRLPVEVIKKLKGKEVLFIEFQDGFVIKPVSVPQDKLAKLQPHPDCIAGSPEDIVRIDWSKEWKCDLP